MKILLLKSDAKGIPSIIKWIDWFSGKGGYGHAAAMFTNGDTFTSHVEHGVSIDSPPLEFPESCWAFFDIGDVDETTIRTFISPEIGSGYDTLAVLRFLIPFFPQSKTKWICSEIVVAALQQIGFFHNVDAWKVSPNQLAKMLFAASYQISNVPPPKIAGSPPTVTTINQ